MLTAWGWNEAFEQAFKPHLKKGYEPALIVQDNKISYTVRCETFGFVEAILAGRVWHEAETNADLPAVGDWVALDTPPKAEEEFVIRARLPRKTCLSRKVPGKGTEQQVIAANVDTVVVVTDTDIDFNRRRLERYLMLINRSGAQPVIVVNKAECLSEQARKAILNELSSICEEAPIHLMSALEQDGIDVLRQYMKPGQSLSFVGSSGVGKSTLINAISGKDDLDTGDVNQTTGKGRHTTTWRSIIFLEGGGMLIDNPGMRELQMWTDEKSLRENFRDIDALAEQCQFHDCKHRQDRGCRVREALESGELEEARYHSYLNLEQEIAKLRQRQKKREMHISRVHRREKKGMHRNYQDRVDVERELGAEREAESD